MKTSILQKCLLELDAPQPRLDYIRGMLETLIDMDGESSKGRTTGFGPVNLGPSPSSPKDITSFPPDEGSILEAKARGRVQTIREIAEKGTESV